LVCKITILVTTLTLISIKPATATESGCWVTDAHGAKVIRVTPAGVEKFNVTGFYYPVSAAIDIRNGDVWVGDTGDGRLTKLNKNGSILKRVYLGAPARLGIDPRNGAVWVVNWTSNEIVKVSASGNVLFRIPNVSRPRFAAVDPRDGSCWTCDRDTQEVIKINASGSIIFKKKKEGNEKEYVGVGGVVDPKTGQFIMYKTSYMGNPTRIIKFDPRGNEIWRYPATGWMANGFGLAVNANDRSIWVGETFYRRITKLTAAGKLLFHVTDFQFQPWTLSVCPGDNSVYVVGPLGVSHRNTFARLAASGRRIVSEKRIGDGDIYGVAAYAGGVAVEPSSLGRIRALFK
jgi:DNA-binding beta-propeller fold protein YncE